MDTQFTGRTAHPTLGPEYVRGFTKRSTKVHAVSSPVEVTVNGKVSPVVNALGWPGKNNVYRADFRVPEGTAAGAATLGLSMAWINRPEVRIPVR